MGIFYKLSDEQILDKINNQNSLNEGISHLYKEHYDSIQKTIVYNNGSVEDSQDIIQETMLSFINMVQNNKFRGESSIKTYLHSIARNIWMTKLKKNKTDDNRNTIWVENNSDNEVDISSHIIKTESLNLISEIFKSIGQVCSDILKKFYYENLSLKEILNTTNFENEQVLRNKKSKCMKNLMEKLDGNPMLKSALLESLKNQL